MSLRQTLDSVLQNGGPSAVASYLVDNGISTQSVSDAYAGTAGAISANDAQSLINQYYVPPQAGPDPFSSSLDSELVPQSGNDQFAALIESFEARNDPAPTVNPNKAPPVRIVPIRADGSNDAQFGGSGGINLAPVSFPSASTGGSGFTGGSISSGSGTSGGGLGGGGTGGVGNLGVDSNEDAPLSEADLQELITATNDNNDMSSSQKALRIASIVSSQSAKNGLNPEERTAALQAVWDRFPEFNVDLSAGNTGDDAQFGVRTDSNGMIDLASAVPQSSSESSGGSSSSGGGLFQNILDAVAAVSGSASQSDAGNAEPAAQPTASTGGLFPTPSTGSGDVPAGVVGPNQTPDASQPSDVWAYDATQGVFTNTGDGSTEPAVEGSDVALEDGGEYVIRPVAGTDGVVAEHVVDVEGNSVATIDNTAGMVSLIPILGDNVFDSSSPQPGTTGTQAAGTGGVTATPSTGSGDVGDGVAGPNQTPDAVADTGSGTGAGDGVGDGTGDGTGNGTGGMFQRGPSITSQVFNNDINLDNIPKGLFQFSRKFRNYL